MQETALPFPIRKRLNVYAEFPTNTTIKLRLFLSQSTHFVFLPSGNQTVGFLQL